MKCVIYATDCFWNRELYRAEDLMKRYPIIKQMGAEIIKTYTADPNEEEDEDGYTIFCEFKTLEDLMNFLRAPEIGEVVLNSGVWDDFKKFGAEFELEIYNDYRE